MKTALRIIAIVAAVFFGIFGLVGLIAELTDPNSSGGLVLAIVFLVLCAVLMFFGLHRSPQEKAERAARRQAEAARIEEGKIGQRAYAQEMADQHAAEEYERARIEYEKAQAQAAAGGEEDPEDDDDFRDDEDDREEVREPAAAAVAAPVVPAASDAPVIPTVSAASDAAVRNARAQKQSSIWETKAMKEQRLVRERKEQAAAAGVACCPRCGSTSLALNKKGFGGGKATAGMFLTGGLGGAVAGTYGMNKMKITCLNCGYEYKPGRKTKI